jgi:hypothetical protein
MNLKLFWPCIVVNMWKIKYQLDATDVFYCRSYCLLNMFRAPLCPSSGARGYYTDGCCLWYLVLWFSSCRYGAELRVVCPVCSPNRTNNHLYNTLELLVKGIMVPETCWANNKICNKNSSVASSWHFIFHIVTEWFVKIAFHASRGATFSIL